MFRLVVFTFLVAALASAVERGAEVRLWPGAAPGSEGQGGPEVFEPAGSKLPSRFTVVHYPSIYVFLPPADKANGAAMVIAPGGGHSQLVIEKEGWQIADWCNRNGIAAFVLKYRLQRAPGSTYTVERDALADAARAVRTVRSRAKEWNVDLGRIGFIGFSAGGEVAALIATRFTAGKESSQDPVERVSSRPDFSVIVYPGFVKGTVIAVPKDAAPEFLVCAHDDPSHVVPTVNLYLELQKAGIPAEMHIYAIGGHGFALRPTKHPVDTWPDRLREWLSDQGLVAFK